MLQKSRSVFLLFAIIVFSLSSCKYDNEEELYPNQSPLTGCDTTGLTYTADMKSFFDTRCALSGCHTPGNFDPDLTVYLQDTAYLSVLYSSATNASHSSRITWDDCDRARLRNWCANPAQ